MTVNLNKYRDSLNAAWQDVLSDKSDTDWALFGYEGQTNDLKFVSKGSGGIEEMTEDLNSGKIMYAFLKVQDPKTSLPKCVLINWQGEGANIVRKGTCANHVREVGNFFSGAHVTINARNEEEIEPQLIIDKVSNSGSAYSFKAPRGERPESSKPVGTNYQRVNPIKEINSEERNKFWIRQEQEEKNRQVEERRKKDEERVKYETEFQLREQEKHAQREALDIQRESAITEIKKAERNAEIISKQHLERESSQTEIEHEVMVNRSDVLRNQRKQEAQELIGKSTSTARSIFEQNTAVGQLSSRAPEKPVRQSIPKHNNENKVKEVAVVKTENVVQQRVELSENDDEEEQFSTIKRSPKVPSEDNNISEPFDINDREMVKNMTYLEQDTINLNKSNEDDGRIRIVTEQQVIDEVIYQDIEEDLGLQARALYDYQAADDTEITFDPGDIITHIDQIDEGWWQGLGPDGSFGLFPANYVEIIQ